MPEDFFPGMWGTSQGLKEKMASETLASISLEQFDPSPGHWDLHFPLVQVVSLAWVGLWDPAEKAGPRCGCSLHLCYGLHTIENAFVLAHSMATNSALGGERGIISSISQMRTPRPKEKNDWRGGIVGYSWQ